MSNSTVVRRVAGLALAFALSLCCFAAPAAFALQHDFETGATTEATPVDPATAELAWSYNFQGADAWAPAVSAPLSVNGDVYLASASKMRILDGATGAEKAQVDLPAAIDYGARCAYADGKILVPLTGGSVIALEPGTLATVWKSDAAPELAAGAQQINSSLSVIDGRVYVATVVPTYSASKGGNLMCLDIATGKAMWTVEEPVGYYWAGVCKANGFVVVGADSGTVYAIAADSADGAPVATLDLGTGVRSSVVADGNDVYVVTKDGVLHRISVAADGKLTETGTAKVGDASTSTPVVAGDSVYVGAGVKKSAGYGLAGALSIVDKATMSVVQIKTVGGNPLMGEVKSRPLVSQQAGGTYVYFTANGADGYPAKAGGDLLMYKVGDSEAVSLYNPAGKNNYCMASVALGDNGMLLYTNDSGNLFAVKAPAAPAPGPAPDPDQGGDGDGGQGGSGDQGGNQSGDQGGSQGGDQGEAQGETGNGAGQSSNGDSSQGGSSNAGSNLPATGDASAPLAVGMIAVLCAAFAGIMAAVRRAE